MTKDLKRIAELQYRIARYRHMGNGTMCQSLSAELRRLLSTPAGQRTAG